jgi:hypothetical protein
VLDGLQPAFSGAREMHSGDMDPHRRLNSIHLKVVDGTSNLELGMLIIKFWETKFGKMVELGRIESVRGVGGGDHGKGPNMARGR